MALLLTAAGCVATPQYAVRQAPAPDESASSVEIERKISAVQAEQFEQEGARPIGARERLWGFEVQALIDKLSQVTERPYLHYRVYLYKDKQPNAAALADGRIYISDGMLTYLAERGGRDDELAFVVSHELAHTVAQHLVKRYYHLQQQQVWLALAAAGAAAATRGASTGVQQASKLAVDLIQQVSFNGYSQEQELEADQLGIRYVRKAGFDPSAALDVLQDFTRFEGAPVGSFLRTHPYSELRRAYLQRYLEESGWRATPGSAAAAPSDASMAKRQQLQRIQQMYPRDSVSWRNLQRQIDALEPH